MADPFAVLGLRHACAEADVKKAYRQLALQYHPDKAGPSGLEAMKQINAAFETIDEGKLWLSRKQHAAPEPKQEPETCHKPKPRGEDGSSSNSGDRSKPRAHQKQGSQYEPGTDRSGQKPREPRPYAESSKRTYFHPKYGSFTPTESRQQYQNNDGPRFSNANNQQRADAKTETESSKATNPQQGNAKRKRSFSGRGTNPFAPHDQQASDAGNEQQKSNRARIKAWDFPFSFIPSPFTQEPPAELWNIVCTDLDTGQRWRQAWSYPSPRGTEPAWEWRHEQFRRAMRQFETHLYSNEPNKINGRFAPDIPPVRHLMVVHEKEINALMKALWVEWQLRYGVTDPLSHLWYRIGELHLLLRLLKTSVGYCYDEELYDQFFGCELSEMVLGTGVAAMMGPDESKAATMGFEVARRRNADIMDYYIN
ncbi:Chaperone protein dnaJ [Exophiala xenobiotica]|uniref:Chaperone protein dnaJ n=1 Tax=Lithohypha guttulata TaxID=1690604 RepID=A0ABR0KL07_9EURO|nr:Chaperone protein dnaJ [Lithohypha guttulata]KAK5325417.1 Chaperone protein dnaJ [Exophiala xenobiotica]